MNLNHKKPFIVICLIFLFFAADLSFTVHDAESRRSSRSSRSSGSSYGSSGSSYGSSGSSYGSSGSSYGSSGSSYGSSGSSYKSSGSSYVSSRSSYRSSRSSYKKSSGSWYKSSSPSKSVWGNRNGGGIFGTKKKSTSSGYSKPGSSGKTKEKSTSGDYKKPEKSSSGSYKKPETRSSSGYRKPTSAPDKSRKTFAGKSAFDKKAAKSLKKKKSAASFAAYQTEKFKFSKKADTSAGKSKSFKSSPVYKKTKNYSDFDYRTHYDRRDNYYRGHGWSTPGYAYNSRPSFGMWDAMVWWMILDNLGSRNHYAMAYHHANDPGYKEWRSEAEQLAQDNEELKKKLEQLDGKVTSMAGTPKQSDYLPGDMPPEVALAANVIADKKADQPELRLATASPGGNYHFFGNLLKKHAAGTDIRLQNTAGSMENLRLLINNKVDAAIVQSDAFGVYKRQFPDARIVASEQTALYTEAVQMIANTRSGIETVKDIEPGGKHILFIGPEGSGTAMTWKGLCAQDEAYKKIQVRHADYETALKQVVEDPRAVMMFVSGLNSDLLRKAENEAKTNKTIRLVEVNDWNFNNATDPQGNKIYRFVNIPGKVYPGLQRSFIIGRDVETIAVEAILVVRTDWVERYGPEAMDALSFAVMESSPAIKNRTNRLEK